MANAIVIIVIIVLKTIKIAGIVSIVNPNLKPYLSIPLKDMYKYFNFNTVNDFF